MNEDEDRLFRALTRLPVMAPDPEREERVRQRCRAAMLRRGRRRARMGAIEITGVAGLCVYLAVVFTEAARLAGSL